jgi:hypothetical protein
MRGDFSDLDDDADFVAVAPAPRWRYKWQRILASFLSGRSWHAVEAVRGLGTTCLHSDVPDLEERGLRFDRERITVAGHGGAEASVVRYTLRRESYAQARALLGLATPSGGSDDDAVRDYRRASGG